MRARTLEQLDGFGIFGADVGQRGLKLPCRKVEPGAANEIVRDAVVCAVGRLMTGRIQLHCHYTETKRVSEVVLLPELDLEKKRGRLTNVIAHRRLAENDFTRAYCDNAAFGWVEVAGLARVDILELLGDGRAFGIDGTDHHSIAARP